MKMLYDIIVVEDPIETTNNILGVMITVIALFKNKFVTFHMLVDDNE